ncbi:hypothetical protein M2103_001315 [Ereboglobus sp. PH5-5]|uniref:MobA/MobL family protein n=1 Tax=Ereboglobus sp. PH5-5 TaxID=2940529 RepID=UPI002407546F|nr:MobA/MobL family protein [Ereboglobus sp. PH5-5]MDF9833098.1 hypothetical protein [Ereboglobus sp. PH5-5]
MSTLPFNCSFSTIQRGFGKGVCSIAAYNTGSKIRDEKNKRSHNYGYKNDVVETGIIMPPDATCALPREDLWNMVESRELRWDSRLARSLCVSLPHVLSDAGKSALTKDIATYISTKLSTFVDYGRHVSIKRGADPRNDHLHLLFPTRKFDGEKLTGKHRDLDNQFYSAAIIEEMRKEIAKIANLALAKEGFDLRVDHRSYERQGLEKKPQQHRGVKKNEVLKKKMGEFEAIEREYASLLAAENMDDFKFIEDLHILAQQGLIFKHAAIALHVQNFPSGSKDVRINAAGQILVSKTLQDDLQDWLVWWRVKRKHYNGKFEAKIDFYLLTLMPIFRRCFPCIEIPKIDKDLTFDRYWELYIENRPSRDMDVPHEPER